VHRRLAAIVYFGRCFVERTGLTRAERANWGEARSRERARTLKKKIHLNRSSWVGQRRRNNWILIFDVAHEPGEKNAGAPPENLLPRMFMQPWQPSAAQSPSSFPRAHDESSSVPKLFFETNGDSVLRIIPRSEFGACDACATISLVISGISIRRRKPGDEISNKLPIFR